MTDYTSFLSCIAQGMDIASAAAVAGLNYNTVLRELERGKMEAERIGRSARPLKPKAAEAEQLTLWYGYQKSKGQITASLLSAIRSSEDWKAHRFLLERVNGAYSDVAIDSDVLGND